MEIRPFLEEVNGFAEGQSDQRVGSVGDGITMAQDARSATAFAMPSAAIDLGRAEILCAPRQMARLLILVAKEWQQTHSQLCGGRLAIALLRRTRTRRHAPFAFHLFLATANDTVLQQTLLRDGSSRQDGSAGRTWGPWSADRGSGFRREEPLILMRGRTRFCPEGWCAKTANVAAFRRDDLPQARSVKKQLQ